ncbi:unnamed protein product [Oncorhynchus mykiss]|uniref:CTNNB1 binding N-teminal domain-containing protein n=1 Tax=Oncorhynchus mykiss TaxID=8022 RepID=A0A060WQZ8_ONCMY|nr:unnamed protein product [Oncorhynchus mykiss]
MPQLNGGGGDDLGANDEMISFKDEGEQDEKISENLSAERDLADVKSSLVNESETNQNSSSDSEAERRPPPRSETFRDKTRESLEEAAKRQDGGLFKSPPYPGYPFIMIPDLTSPYLPNGSLSPTARTVSSFIYTDVRTLMDTHDPRSLEQTRIDTQLGVFSSSDLPCRWYSVVSSDGFFSRSLAIHHGRGRLKPSFSNTSPDHTPNVSSYFLIFFCFSASTYFCIFSTVQPSLRYALVWLQSLNTSLTFVCFISRLLYAPFPKEIQ